MPTDNAKLNPRVVGAPKIDNRSLDLNTAFFRGNLTFDNS
jgi:hypothetical protein